MGTGSAVLYVLSLPFLRTTSQRLHSEQHLRLEERCKDRARIAGFDGGMRLEEALCGFREEFEVDTDVQFRAFVSGKQQCLSQELYEQIYFISREAVGNAFRHSAAAAVEVELLYTGHELRVSVRDNGCGMDQQIVRSGRSSNRGLLEMRERAEAVGGQFRIWSKAGAGTEIEFSVPLNGMMAN